MKGPIAAVAAVGAILGGLAGYWNAIQAVKGAAGAAGAAEPAAARLPAPKSIAVLAFANLGDDRPDEQFADGVSEELLNILARVPGLRVTARRSSFQFRGQAAPLAEMARQLQVAYLVDGTVRKAGARIVITAQLVQASDGAVLWSDRFDSTPDDVLAAQAELALRIAARLNLRLEAASLAGSGTRNAQAWQLFLQGRASPLGRREDFYRRALALDPQFARAHVELAREVFRRANVQSTPIDGAAVRASASAHAQEALRIDPGNAQAQVMLAYAATWTGDRAAFALHARRVMELNPSDPDAHDLAADLHLQEGRMDDALAAVARMVELDPLDGHAHAVQSSWLLLAQQPQRALQAIERARLIDPDDFRYAASQSRILLALGRRDEALALARRAASQPRLGKAAIDVLVLAGSPEDGAALQARTDLQPIDHARIALLHGQTSAFLDWLEAEPRYYGQMSFGLFDPVWDAVRAEPRFQAWLQRLQLTQAHARAQAWRAANPAPR